MSEVERLKLAAQFAVAWVPVLAAREKATATSDLPVITEANRLGLIQADALIGLTTVKVRS